MLSPLVANPLASNARKIAPTLATAVRYHILKTKPAVDFEYYNTRFFSSKISESSDLDSLINTSNLTPGNTLSKDDLKQIELLIKKDREELLKQIRDNGHWDLDYAREKIIGELEDKGMSHEEAVAEFTKIDDEIDKTRAAMKSPYLLGAAIPAAAIPASWALVYNQPFYDWVSTNWPWLTATSWDWSEPLLQSLLATEVGATLLFASLSALGYQNYNRRVNANLVEKIVKNSDISRSTAKKFIKVDVDNRNMK